MKIISIRHQFVIGIDRGFESIKGKKRFLGYKPNFTYQYEIPLIKDIISFKELELKIDIALKERILDKLDDIGRLVP